MGILTIYLDRIENLVNDDLMGKSDPYVVFEMEEDRILKDKNYGSMQSTKKKDQQSPFYGETFRFNIPSLKNMELICKVMDDDAVHDDKLGKCKFELDKMHLTRTPQEVSRKVDRNLIRKDAIIHLRLSYEE
jgi:Ca2+-dependent lipid-binding protein